MFIRQLINYLSSLSTGYITCYVSRAFPGLQLSDVFMGEGNSTQVHYHVLSFPAGENTNGLDNEYINGNTN